MAHRLVRVWKYHLRNILYAEISNGMYSGNLYEIILNDKRKITSLRSFGGVTWAGEEFFEDCSLVSKTVNVHYSENGYPWNNRESGIWIALEKLYGKKLIVPKKFDKIKQPKMTCNAMMAGEMKSPVGTW